jgi:hypothetical protein
MMRTNFENFEVFSDSDDDELEGSSRSSSSNTSDMWKSNQEVLTRSRYWGTDIDDTSEEESVNIFLPEEEDSGINLDTRMAYIARVKTDSDNEGRNATLPPVEEIIYTSQRHIVSTVSEINIKQEEMSMDSPRSVNGTHQAMFTNVSISRPSSRRTTKFERLLYALQAWSRPLSKAKVKFLPVYILSSIGILLLVLLHPILKFCFEKVIETSKYLLEKVVKLETNVPDFGRSDHVFCDMSRLILTDTSQEHTEDTLLGDTWEPSETASFSRSLKQSFWRTLTRRVRYVLQSVFGCASGTSVNNVKLALLLKEFSNLSFKVKECDVSTVNGRVQVGPKDRSTPTLSVPGSMLSGFNKICDMRNNSSADFVIMFDARHVDSDWASEFSLNKDFPAKFESETAEARLTSNRRFLPTRLTPRHTFKTAITPKPDGQSDSGYKRRSFGAFENKPGFQRFLEENGFPREFQTVELENWYCTDHDVLFGCYQSTAEVDINEEGDMLVVFHFDQLDFSEVWYFDLTKFHHFMDVPYVVEYANVNGRPDLLLYYLLCQCPYERMDIIDLVAENLWFTNHDFANPFLPSRDISAEDEDQDPVYYVPDEQVPDEQGHHDESPSQESALERVVSITTSSATVTSPWTELCEDYEDLVSKIQVLKADCCEWKFVASMESPSVATEVQRERDVRQLFALTARMDEALNAIMWVMTENAPSSLRQNQLFWSLAMKRQRERVVKNPHLPMLVKRYLVTTMVSMPEGEEVRMVFLIDSGSPQSHLNMIKLRGQARLRQGMKSLVKKMNNANESTFLLKFLNFEEDVQSKSVTGRCPIIALFGTQRIHHNFPYDGVIGADFIQEYMMCRGVQNDRVSIEISINPDPTTTALQYKVYNTTEEEWATCQEGPRASTPSTKVVNAYFTAPVCQPSLKRPRHQLSLENSNDRSQTTVYDHPAEIICIDDVDDDEETEVFESEKSESQISPMQFLRGISIGPIPANPKPVWSREVYVGQAVRIGPGEEQWLDSRDISAPTYAWDDNMIFCFVANETFEKNYRMQVVEAGISRLQPTKDVSTPRNILLMKASNTDKTLITSFTGSSREACFLLGHLYLMEDRMPEATDDTSTDDEQERKSQSGEIKTRLRRKPGQVKGKNFATYYTENPHYRLENWLRRPDKCPRTLSLSVLSKHMNTKRKCNNRRDNSYKNEEPTREVANLPTIGGTFGNELYDDCTVSSGEKWRQILDPEGEGIGHFDISFDEESSTDDTIPELTPVPPEGSPPETEENMEQSRETSWDLREYSVFTVYAQILNANMQRTPSLIAATERHPYVSIPIGLDAPNAPSAKALLDTGAGLNIGRLSYWDDFQRKFPQYVKAFGPIDFDQFEKVMVGSVNKESMATVCTHYIELYTPLMENGRPVSLRIGLADGFAANLILGLPFAVRARMVIYLAEAYVFSQTFQRTFPLEFLTAISQTTVPRQDDAAIPTFLASPFEPVPDVLMDLPALRE